MIPQRFLSADEVKAQIQRLLADWPELREDDEALALSLESETDAIEFCTRLVRKIGETKAYSEGTANYIAELRARQETLDLRIERLRGILMSVMQTAGMAKLPLPIASLSVSYRQHVVIADRDLIPEYYRREPPWEPNKILIGASLKAGDVVPGCEMSNPEPSLTIRVK